MDTELDRVHLHIDTPCAKSAKKTVFGSIERGVDRLKEMLTPRKRNTSTVEGVRKVRVCILHVTYCKRIDAASHPQSCVIQF